MVSIMCTQRLRRALRQAGCPPAKTDGPMVEGAILGNWVAQTFKVDGRALVVALNVRTYLTVVFPVEPRDTFRTRFADALRMALQDLGVPLGRSVLESAALEVAPLVRLTDRTLLAALGDLQFFCDLELTYHTDFGTVQRNLNQLPHPGRSPCVPADAVMELLEGTPASGAVLLMQ